MIAVLCVAADSVRAADESTFAKANQAYGEGRFEEAVAGYEDLVRSGHWHANLFYDLGNAWFRLGNFGKAILNYERALALDPRHPEADANLRLARDEARALELRKTPDRALSRAGLRCNNIRSRPLVAFWFAFVLLRRASSLRAAVRLGGSR